MSGFTFLTEEQTFGDNKLDIINKRGTSADISDFSILLGGWKGDYWLKSGYDGSYASSVSGSQLSSNAVNRFRVVGARPVLPFTSISNIPTNGKDPKRATDDVLEVEYGYYPQNVVEIEMQKRLERAYRSSNISKTGNSYTTDSVLDDDYDTAFQPRIHQEYEYRGRRYVRVEITHPHKKFCLSDGSVYGEGEIVWVEVEPVKWLVDEKEKIMITEDVIFAGVQFHHTTGSLHKNFNKTDIKKFMDNYFANDLVQGIKKETVQVSQAKAETTNTKIKNKNPYNLEFDEVSETEIIRGAIESNVSVFLHGEPGCGKSDRVRQLDPDFIELNLSHLDPELLDGLAGEKEGKAVHIKPPWLEELEEKCQEEPDKIHILFLEELTNASPMMQAKAYGIALDKKVAGRWQLPQNARVVAAGNEIEDSLAANEMAEPLYDRFAHVNIETTADNWLEWAITPESFYERIDYKEEKARPKIHPAIYGFIATEKDSVLRTDYDREYPQPHADPRRWKMASDMLYATNNPNTLEAIVGKDLTEAFKAFCKIPRITVEDVIKRNYKQKDLEMDLGEKLATISGLVQVDDENMPVVRNFVKKLGAEMCKKFEVQWAAGNEERLEQLQELRLKEKEEAERRSTKGHSLEEAKGTLNAGISSFRKIFGGYQEYLAREETKSDELKDK